MIKSIRKSTVVKVAAAAAAVGALASIGLAGNSPANADPKQYSALVGYGSDTTQDVLNAMAGFKAGQAVLPIASQDSSKTQLASWDAFPAGCITPRTAAPTIVRPNGSGNGLRMLSRAYGGGTFAGTPACGGNRTVTGMIDFARSSSGPTTAGTALTYIPFGRGAITFAYNKPTNVPAGGPVTNLTTAQLTSLFGTGGPQLISNGTNDVVVIPCGIQTGSGTGRTWNSMIGLGNVVDGATGVTGTTFCNSLLGVSSGDGRLQESNGPELTAKANLLATTSNPICDGVPGGPAVSCADAQVIVGFAPDSFIARSRGLAAPAPGPGVFLGSINGIAPITGTTPATYAANAAFYNTSFGRDVYNVLASDVVADVDNVIVQTMFVGSTSSVCQASALIAEFGFLTLGANCGSTALTGGFEP
jgi:ABC-type phosphate transport system substrate-binding protein